MTGHHGNRHGRSEHARQAVLHAADDLLVEKGFAGVTIEGIAARAGVAKQTIYRWWNSKTDILLDTFTEDAAEHLASAEHEDVRTYLRQLADFLTNTDAGAVLRALIGQAQHDPDLAATFRARFLDDQRTRDRKVLGRELPAGVDLEVAVDELVGPIYYRVLVTGQPVDGPFIDALVDRFTTARRCEP
ncbi:MAG TPA: TetR/AcrR family transcriptional regulator [Pseudonocardiaceae bacterium]|jgi:AcrR family transcriptional regulator|nr:TetR/AcrR family transcriptional regulator [Pseudonocardiaceae bacterium]